MKKRVLQKMKAILLMSLHFGFIYLLMNPVNLGSVEENLFMTIFVLIEVYVVTVFFTSLIFLGIGTPLSLGIEYIVSQQKHKRRWSIVLHLLLGGILTLLILLLFGILPPFSAWMDTEILLKVVFLLFYPVGSLLVFERLIDRRKSARQETYQQAENN